MAVKIALAGNPNSGKTTLFNALTGSNQFVGNWPGVTVEKKEGRLKDRKEVTITDLPGIYSLSPYTLEEVVARNWCGNMSSGRYRASTRTATDITTPSAHFRKRSAAAMWTLPYIIWRG